MVEEQWAQQHCTTAEHHGHAHCAAHPAIDLSLAHRGEGGPAEPGEHRQADAGEVGGDVAAAEKPEQGDTGDPDPRAEHPRVRGWSPVKHGVDHPAQHRTGADGCHSPHSDSCALDGQEVAELEHGNAQCAEEGRGGAG